MPFTDSSFSTSYKKSLKRTVIIPLCSTFAQNYIGMFSIINIFRIVALLEGVSYILLLFIATPIKYLADDPQYVKLLGMPHGILFIAYITIAFLVKKDYSWTNTQFGIVLLASIIPFGTFYVDRKYLKPVK